MLMGMRQRRMLKKQGLKIAIALFGIASGAASVALPAFSQITPDSSLPTSSLVNRVENRLEITGGTTANTNLFHSFREFSLPTNFEAYFKNSPAIQNILTRVTGSSISNIDGLLKANGSANLFVINPNGIIFGQNASLEIGGSFLATTANSIRFLGGGEFSAIPANSSPLLLMTVPVGLQFGTNNGAIAVQGNGNGNGLSFDPDTFAIVRPEIPFGLKVQSGRTLALVGGDISLQGANLSAASGRIELGSVAGNGLVAIAQTAGGWTLNYDNIRNFGNIVLEQAAIADTSGIDGGGNIQVRGKQVSLTDGSVLLAVPLGDISGGEVLVGATDLVAAKGVFFDTVNEIAQFPSGIFTDVGLNAAGKGTDIVIATKRLEVTGGAQISAGTAGSGDAGNLKVNAGEVFLSGRADDFPSGLFASVSSTDVTGNSGNILVQSDLLQVTNGGQITTNTFGIGQAGNLDITATTVSLIGTPSAPTTVSSAVEVGATGDGGRLRITADNLSVANGSQIAVSTRGAGNAGDLLINAKTIDIAGQVVRGSSGLFANNIIARGNGGNILVNSDRLTVRDGGIISASNFPSAGSRAPAGRGSVGNITVNTPQILLDAGRINIDSAGGDRGNILLNSQLLNLRNGSSISTNALGSATGGNITVNTDFLVAVPIENSDITANAANNFGGRNTIAAKNVFGFQTNNRLSDLSDITATSALGSQFDGIVEIRTPDTDLSRGLVKLPDNLNDPNKQIVAACERFRGNELIVTGRGGVPADATQPLPSQAIWRDLRWAEVLPTQLNSAKPENAANQAMVSQNSIPNSIPNSTSPFSQIEAQGWESKRNGDLKLLALNSQSVFAWQLPSICAGK
jgi:filamentous hemagglutinin family protein